MSPNWDPAVYVTYPTQDIFCLSRPLGCSSSETTGVSCKILVLLETHFLTFYLFVASWLDTGLNYFSAFRKTRLSILFSKRANTFRGCPCILKSLPFLCVDFSLNICYFEEVHLDGSLDHVSAMVPLSICKAGKALGGRTEWHLSLFLRLPVMKNSAEVGVMHNVLHAGCFF